MNQALAIRLHTFGPEHPDVILTGENYAQLLEHLHKNEEAARLRATLQAEAVPEPAEQPGDNN